MKSVNEEGRQIVPVRPCLILSEADFHSVYQKAEHLGEGSFGEVYRWNKKKEFGGAFSIEHYHLPEKVAGKQTNVRESKEEIEILTKLDHGNVVKCFGHFSMTGCGKPTLGMIVMELCKGSLKDLIKCKMLRDYEMSRLMRQMLEGLDYIHEHGIIHRDIKPDNFLLMTTEQDEAKDWKCINTSNMTVKLADFGCGRRLNGQMSRNNALTIEGNLAYCAPEVLEGKMKSLDKINYSRKSDIWSVAAVAYKCITGKLLSGIVNGKVDISCMDGTNRHLHDFLKQIFCENVDERPSAKSLLSHAFITDVQTHAEDFIPSIQTDDRGYLRQLNLQFDVNKQKFEAGKHPLDVAVSYKRLGCLQILVEEGRANIADGNTLLVSSMNQLSDDIVEYLLAETEIDVNETDSFGNTALNVACQRRSSHLIQLLCGQKGIDANAGGRAALHEAAIHCDVNDFEHIAKNTNADLGSLDNTNKNRTLLMSASAAGNINIVKFLTEKLPVQVEQADTYGTTALHVACINGQLGVVDYLIREKSADPGVTDSEGRTILHVSAFYNETKVVQYLISRNILDGDLRKEPENYTPLHFACEKDCLEVTQCLIQHSANIEAKNVNGKTPFWLACHFNSIKVIKFLANDVSADVNTSDNDGLTPLHVACKQGHLDLVKFLVTGTNIKVRAKTEGGHEAVHLACIGGHFNILRWFIENVSNLDILTRDNDGDTLLHLACEMGHQKIVKYFLMKQLIDENELNNNSETPLHCACKKNNVQIVRMLLSKTDISKTNSTGKSAQDVAELYGNQGVVACLRKYAEKKALEATSRKRERKMPSENVLKDASVSCSQTLLETLHEACKTGEANLVDKILSDNLVELCSEKNSFGENAIHVASKHGNVEALQCMLRHGVSCVNDKDEISQYTPLQHAVQNGNLEVVRCLVESGQVTVDENSRDGLSLLDMACRLGFTDIVNYLVHEASLDDKKGSDSKGWAALRFATNYGKLEIIQHLCEEQRYLLDVWDSKGKNLMHIACQMYSTEIVKYIFDKKPENSIMVDKDGNLPVHYAADADRKKNILIYLIEEAGCDPTVFNGDGQNILHIASRNDCIHILSYLIHEERIDREVEDMEGMLDIHIAAQEGHVDIMEHLINRENVDANVATGDGRTPLIFACAYGHLNVVKFLLNETKADRTLLHPSGDQDLNFASAMGHLDVVRYLVENHSADVNLATRTGKTALLIACRDGHLDVVKYLVGDGNTNRMLADENGYCDIHYATWQGHLEIIKYLVEECSTDVNILTNIGRTPLHIACLHGHNDLVEYLLCQCGADRFLTDDTGGLDIHYASQGGHLEIVKYLIKNHSADVDVASSKGLTPLHLACRDGHLHVVDYLIREAKANRFLKDENDSLDLHFATLKGHQEIVKYLVETQSADVNMPTNNGITPYLLACAEGWLDIVEFFFDYTKVDRCLTDNFGNWDLHLATCKCHVKVVKYLVEKQFADINVTKNNGTTPLHIACQDGQLDLVKYIMGEANGNRLARDNNGNLDVHFATQKGHLDIIKYLVTSHSANVNVQSNNGRTPFHIACRDGHLDLVNYLIIDAKADMTLKDQSGWLGIHFASQEGHLEIIKHLVQQHLVDVNAKTNGREKPIDIAFGSFHFDVANYLLNKANAVFTMDTLKIALVAMLHTMMDWPSDIWQLIASLTILDHLNS